MQAAVCSPMACCNPDLQGAARVEGGHMIARTRPHSPADLTNWASRLCFPQCLAECLSFSFFLTAFYDQALSLPLWRALGGGRWSAG